MLRVLFIGLVLIPGVKVTPNELAPPVMEVWAFPCWYPLTLCPIVCLPYPLSIACSIMQLSYIFFVALLLLLEFFDKTAARNCE